jgi:meso-butanediol dehydrogenase/(S,S)-butanediol dehydrogenase/diacetyl reductase
MTDMFVAASEAVAAELSVTGRSVVITGGGAGIGRAAAMLLARKGAQVVVADIRGDRVEEALGAIRAEGEGHAAEGLVVDVAKPAQIQAAIDRAVEAYGRLDIMINAAGVIHVVPFLEVSPEQYRATLDVNVAGTFFGTQLAARRMIAQAPNRQPGELIGRIINFTSPGGESNSDTQTVYALSKAAVNRITGGAAVALFRPYGICVSALKPYAIPSPMLQGIFEAREELFGLPEGEPARQRARHLVHGRFEPIEAHAEVLVWMCAAPPDVINGRYVTSVPHTAPL